MATLFKNLKFPDLDKNKLMTLDEDGFIKATNKDIDSIADKNEVASEISEVNKTIESNKTETDNRLAALEASVQSVSAKLTDINGETV